MYPTAHFGGILTISDVLGSRNQYVFTYAHGRVFEYNSSEWVQGELTQLLSSWGRVISVKRPLFSDHYIIVIQPTMDLDLTTWQQAFEYAWQTMGYNHALFVSAETGSVSSDPGGLSAISQGIEETISSTVGAATGGVAKSVLPYAAIAVGLYAAVILLPTLAKRK